MQSPLCVKIASVLKNRTQSSTTLSSVTHAYLNPASVLRGVCLWKWQGYFRNTSSIT